jgi:gamma-glutamylcyclotransferase (GGCT)/AIG2-like uncharacterized protein YtfP
LPPNTDCSEPSLLFAYGTLRPATIEAEAAGGWVPDRVRGRMFDFGAHPALVDWDDPEAGWVEGDVRPVDRRELEERLDPYEGVAEGPFRRVAVITEAGRSVWIYVYTQPLPPGARGPIERWEAVSPGSVA